MTLPVFWTPEADADVREARLWYENIQAELGQRFASAIAATVTIIGEHPLQFPIVHRTLRRVGVYRFPYGIFFEVQERLIVVMACFHAKRDPRHWRSR